MKFSKLIRNPNATIILVDLLMIAILIANLALIVFDSIFSYESVQELLLKYLPDFYTVYNDNIHIDFIIIDLWFVSVFVVEFILRWIVSVVRNEYHRWFFYPFIHWYDVLGCIPIGSFRALRFLRIFAIIYRMQKLKIIDITKSFLYKKYRKYKDILTEEVSDRVVVNVIQGMQDEISEGTPVIDKIVDEVLLPRKDVIAKWFSRRVQKAAMDNYDAYKGEIDEYVEGAISQAIENNKELDKIEKIPVFGKPVVTTIEKTVREIVLQVVHKAFQDLGSPRNNELIQDITDRAMEAFITEEQDKQSNEAVKRMATEALDIIKDQVNVQQWKLKEVKGEV